MSQRILFTGVPVRHRLLQTVDASARRPMMEVLEYAGGAELISHMVDFPNVEKLCASTSPYTLEASAQITVDPVRRISSFLGRQVVRSGSLISVGPQAFDLVYLEMPSGFPPSHAREIDEWLLAAISSLPLTPKAHAIVKMDSAQFLSSAVMKALLTSFDYRLDCVLSVNALRSADGLPTISNLSWEQASAGIVRALRTLLGDTASDRQPRHVYVNILHEGAVCYSPSGADVLVYDPKYTEGEWSRKQRGRMIGFTQCLAAAIVRARLSGSDDFLTAAQSALMAGRRVFESGFLASEPVFPVSLALDTMRAIESGQPAPIRSITLPENDGDLSWSILREKLYQPPGPRARSWADIKGAIYDLVRFGADKLDSVPSARFGRFTTFVREEIEALRGISGLLRDYAVRKAKRPLSLAVFGAPGSGKSFGVKQLEQDVREELQTVLLEFNLSQFVTASQLHVALHQIRDKVLDRKLPIVLWDEFDGDASGRYGWFKHFLAPMQDGSFLEDGIPHSIGKCVFVFVGGTTRTMEEFGERVQGEKDAKGPDFLSRLQGYMNIGGIDHDGILLGGSLVRRALLLNVLLGDYAAGTKRPGLGFDVDPVVMDAFLCTEKFHHGARSIESLLAMCRCQGKSRFDTSCLPPEAQATLHVDLDEWTSLLEGRETPRNQFSVSLGW